MDASKDLQKGDRPSRFLDNKTLRVQAFGGNISAERAYRRAERLVAAIHLVTNHISAEEPARIRARRSGLELLSSILMLRDEMRSIGSESFRKSQALLQKLISLVRILSVSGHVSTQNAETLVDGLDELANFLVASKRSAFSENVHFEKEEFLDTERLPIPRERLSDKTSVKRRRVGVKDKGTISSDRDSALPARTERIVGTLVNQGQLGIKDISATLPEYSEKMIQRELKGLVALGRVKKSGSKRWSTYTLAQS